MSEHIAADHALSLLTLAPEDPERKRALAHAAGCEACRALLDEGQQLLALLDQGLQDVPALEPAFAARVERAVLGQKTSRRSRWAALALALGALLSCWLALFALHHGDDQPQHSGVRCFLFEQGFAAVAFGMGALYARQLAGRMSAWQWGAIAMTGALSGQALLLLRCNANGAALHILLAHVLGVVCATGLGALVGRRVRASAA